MPEHTYTFNVSMSCSGCSNAIERVLKRLEGVKSFDVNLENQSVSLITAGDSPSFETVLATIRKTGKTVNSAEADGVTQSLA
ncbi:Cytosolic copper metallochaperone [Ascosphaera acerosa]|nr:Cytosolic copper metallochaperone [Ascosphaera acerosa]